jgi:hypothetical protein
MHCFLYALLSMTRPTSVILMHDGVWIQPVPLTSVIEAAALKAVTATGLMKVRLKTTRLDSERSLLVAQLKQQALEVQATMKRQNQVTNVATPAWKTELAYLTREDWWASRAQLQFDLAHFPIGQQIRTLHKINKRQMEQHLPTLREQENEGLLRYFKRAKLAV